MRVPQALLLGGLFVSACSGSINCGGCVPGGLAPIPGGFPDEANLDLAADIRLTQAGLDFLGREFGALTSAYARMKCGPGEPVACPTEFVVGGQRAPSSCGPDDTCVGPGGAGEPVLGFEVEQATQSGATVCRDPLMDPTRRECFAWLRLEGLRLTPRPPSQLEAEVRAQIYTSVIPIRYDALGMDCVVTLDSNASGASVQDFTVTAEVGPWTPPAGAPGGQLSIHVTDVTAMIPDGDITIERDPIHGDIGDTITCGIANIGRIKSALVGRLVGSLGDIIDEEIGKVLAQRCGRPNEPACPPSTQCSPEGRCEVTATGELVPQRMGAEGRMDLAGLLPGLGGPGGELDVAGLVGGTAGTDATGVEVGLRAGVEVSRPDPRCSVPGISPRLRPGATPPVALPAENMVDLDFDGTPERGFMLAAGISQQILDQLAWGIANSGVLCAAISTYDISLINTGSLAVLMPSLNQLTHADRFSWSVWPARVAMRPTAEPRVIIGEGKTSGTSPNIVLETPLITLRIPGLELSFDAVVEERWVHLMTVRADVDVPLGVFAEPGGGVRLLVGDLGNSVTNVQVIDSEILAESSADLEGAVPALLSLVLPRLTDALSVPFALPSGRDLGGFEPTFLGARGVPGAGGGFSHVGMYLDLAFDPALAGPISYAVDTRASVERLLVPTSAEMSVAHPGGPRVPELELSLEHLAPAGADTEAQLRIDGGSWSPFTASRRISLVRPELLVQGVHQIEVRARERFRPQTLDPTPARVTVVVDTEAPQLEAELRERDTIWVRARDVVSGDRLSYRAWIDGVAYELSLDADGVAVSEAARRARREVRIEAVDEAGNRAARVVWRGAGLDDGQAAPSEGGAAGCACARPAPRGAPMALALAGLALLSRGRRRARPAR